MDVLFTRNTDSGNFFGNTTDSKNFNVYRDNFSELRSVVLIDKL